MATKYTDTLEQYPDWVDAKEDQAHRAIFAMIRDFDKNYSNSISSASLRGIRQYLNRGVTSIYSNGYMNEVDSSAQSGLTPSTTKMNFNLTAAVIDTLTSKLASIQAIPQAVTDKGNVKGRKLAEDLNYIIKGLFQKKNLTHAVNLAFRGAMIGRAEFLKVSVDAGEVSVDRVLVDEIVIDPADGYYNDPYKMVHRKFVPLHVALKKWPKFEKEIRDATIQEVRQYNTQTYTPCVVVAEAWCRNSYIEKGRHVICIENVDILDEEWDKDYFPVVKCNYNEPVIGWIGQSVVDELDPIQREIDRILVTMQAIMKLVSVPRVFIDTNAQVNKEHLTNKIGMAILYDGKSGVAPIIHNGASMPPELPAQLEFLIQQGYARVGLTPMDTQGQKPSGLQSGEAIKTMTEVKSERWQMLQQNYEHKIVELANIILWELQGTNVKICALDKHIGLREISTKRIPKTKESYVLQVFPVSALPSSIPDRMDSLTQMVNLGVVTREQLPELMDMPDLGSVVALQSAPIKLVDKILEEMEDSHKYINPEPYHNLKYALTAALQRYSWTQLNAGDKKYLVLLRKFINDVKTLLAQEQVPAIPGQAPQPAQSSSPVQPSQPITQG